MSRRKRRIPFRYLEPVFFGGLLDDPLLFLRIRPSRRALLFDCGQIAHLAKRVVKPIDTVFISHAHMDHCMGIPTLVSHHHASPKPLRIYGPPGIAQRIGHQLQGYDWNLCEPYWFTIQVHEVHETALHSFLFSGPERFACSFAGKKPRLDTVIWSCRFAEVAAVLLDHKIPVLAFRITEKPPFNIDLELLRRQGLTPGAWLRDLKKRLRGDPGPSGGASTWEGAMATREEDLDLYGKIHGKPPCASVGYLTDIGWTPENRDKISEFFAGITLLCTECTFLGADRDKARASYHLCTDDLNELAAILMPGWLLPMHLSKSYLRRSVDLYGELQLPERTKLLPLPQHLVPAPLKCEDLEVWLRPEHQEHSG